jgi:hypothetical protein
LQEKVEANPEIAPSSGMNRIQVLFISLTMTVATVGAAEAGFWQQLAPDERRAAGLDQLTPEQQAALDQLAGRYAREGAHRVREQAKQEARAEVKQEVKQEVREEVKQEMKAEERRREVAMAGLLVADNETVIHSRIAGSFNGWSGATVFHLENGQTWVQSNKSDTMWLPTMDSPMVEIRASKLGGWKLYLLENGLWLRVRRVD